MKNFRKFKPHFIFPAALFCVVVLCGAKAWQDPGALPASKDCGQYVCCAHCLVTTASMAPERTAGWEWKLRFADKTDY